MAGEGYKYIEMLLDKQRTQALLDQQDREFQSKQMQDSIETGLEAASQLSGAMRQGKRDNIANQLMNQNDPPRAQAVNADAPGVARANAVFGGASTPARGGADELGMRMELSREKRLSQDSRFDNMVAGLREQRLSNSLTQRRAAALHQQAVNLSRQTSQKTKDMVTAAGAYTKNMALQRKGLAAAQAAGNFEEYDSIAGDMQALHYGSVSSGLKLPPLNIPDYVPPGAAMDDDLDAATREWERTRARATAKPGQWDSTGDWLNGKTAGEEYMAASERLGAAQTPYTKRPVTKYVPEPDIIPLDQDPMGQASGADPDLTLQVDDMPVPPPQQAIDMLKSNPGLAAAFEEKYGSGSAEYYLGK